jgi:HAD superfamily hydrolase (TIGR01509 family)
MLKAIIFDFNGIILNDEPYHYRSMRDAVAELGVHITEEEYYAEYLPMDDWSCLEAICRNHSINITPEQRERTLKLKPKLYRDLLQGGYPFVGGVDDFIRAAAERYPIALASGARREEIESALVAKNLLDCFRVILGAEDFSVSKPAPQSYLSALEKLNRAIDGSYPVRPDECLVIEDSIGGVKGARAAGMACLAVAGTYPREMLSAATRVVDSLQEITFDSLQELCERQP